MQNLKNHMRLAAVALALFGSLGLAAAQEVNPASVPDLKLSKDQKHTIYLSISNLKQRETAPPTFRAATGAVLPSSVELQPLPKTIVDLIPQMKDYEYAMVTNQVLLVDPKTRQVLEIINE